MVVFTATLETGRLRLRPIEEADRGFLFGPWQDDEVRRFLGGAVEVGQLEPRFAAYRTPPDIVGVWLAETRGGGAPVGVLSLHPHQDGTGHEVSFEFAAAFLGAWVGAGGGGLCC